MRDANDRLPVQADSGEMGRLKQLFADAFGPDVLNALPLRLDALRQRRALQAREWNRFAPLRTTPRP